MNKTTIYIKYRPNIYRRLKYRPFHDGYIGSVTESTIKGLNRKFGYTKNDELFITLLIK